MHKAGGRKSSSKRRRIYNVSRIKQDYSYSLPEICILLGTHKNTVHQWLRKGLHKINDAKPFLIHGSELKAFLAAQQSSRKMPCKLDEFYCCRCRQPRCAWGGVVDIHLRSSKVMNLRALCEQCECALNKSSGIKNLPLIAKVFNLQAVHNSHIVEILPPSVRCYLERTNKT